jgi:hypothetical protein
VATPQPRNNFNDDRIQIQLDMRDSTFSIFQDHAINFWDGFQTVDNGLDASLDSGDGVHMNDAGHRELFLRALAEEVPALLINSKTEVLNSVDNELSNEAINLYPNPATEEILLEWGSKPILLADIYDSEGKLVLKNSIAAQGGISKLDISELPSGVYYILLLNDDGQKSTMTFVKK